MKNYAVVDTNTKKVTNLIEVNDDWSAPTISGVSFIWIDPETYEANKEDFSNLYLIDEDSIGTNALLDTLFDNYNSKVASVKSYYSAKRKAKTVTYDGNDYLDLSIDPETQTWLYYNIWSLEELTALTPLHPLVVAPKTIEVPNIGLVEIPSVKKLLIHLGMHERVCRNIYTQKIKDLAELYDLEDIPGSTTAVNAFNPESGYPADLIIAIDIA